MGDVLSVLKFNFWKNNFLFGALMPYVNNQVQQAKKLQKFSLKWYPFFKKKIFKAPE